MTDATIGEETGPGAGPVTRLRETVAAAAREYSGDSSLDPALEASPRPEMGDFSTNAAMLMAKSMGRNPREIAAGLAARIEADLGRALAKTEVAGPGFINLFLADDWFRSATFALAKGRAGVEPVANRRRILVEFVSANPTGPLHVGHGRQSRGHRLVYCEHFII